MFGFRQLFVFFLMQTDRFFILWQASYLLNTGYKLNVHENFGKCPGLLLNVLRTFDIRLKPRGSVLGDVLF